MGEHPQRQQHPHHRPHRLWQNPRRLPLGTRRPAPRTRSRNRRRHAHPLHLAPQSTRRRRRTQPTRTTDWNHAPERKQHGRTEHQRGRAQRRPPRTRTPPTHQQPARHSHHHPRIPLPHAHQRRPQHPRGRHHRDRGRDPQPRRHQTRRTPGSLPRTPRRAPRKARTAHWALRNRRKPRGGRPVPRRHSAGDHHEPTGRQRMGPASERARTQYGGARRRQRLRAGALRPIRICALGGAGRRGLNFCRLGAGRGTACPQRSEYPGKRTLHARRCHWRIPRAGSRPSVPDSG